MKAEKREKIELIPYENNPRKMSQEQLKKLGRALHEFGDLSGIVRNVRDNRLIAGHQRLKSLIERHGSYEVVITGKNSRGERVGFVRAGDEEISYREVDWPEEKAVPARIAANQIHGDWDKAKLEVELNRALNLKIDFNLTGFDQEWFEIKLAKEQKRAEVEFSKELLLEHNYIVLYFDNPFDWQVAQEKFGLKKVKDLLKRKGQPVGIGRVVNGAEWLDRIK